MDKDLVKVTLPQQNENQRRGLQSEDILSSVLSKFSFVNRIENSVDIGVDFICEYRTDDKPTGQIFNVQCKAVPISWYKNTKKDIKIRIYVKTARYWMQLPNITLLMVVDPKNGNVYWLDPIKHLTARKDDWRNKTSIEFRVKLNSVFNCFESAPQNLIDNAKCSGNHLSVSLRERLYDTKKLIDEERPKGLSPNSTVVARVLMADSPLQDAIKSSIELDKFQSEIYENLLHRANKYCNQLPGFINKWYGKNLRRSGMDCNPLETDLGGDIPKDVLDSSMKIINELNVDIDNRQFDKLLNVLDNLETLERNAFKIEEIEYNFEKPLLDFIMEFIK